LEVRAARPRAAKIMSAPGQYFLLFAWALSLFGVVAGAIAGRSGRRAWFESARRSTMLVALCLACSIAILGYQFLTNHYTSQYVWQDLNVDMSPVYKFTAIWGGMDGSMLLWCFIVSVMAGILAWQCANMPQRLTAWTLSVANTTILFFASVTAFLTNPF